MSYIQKFVGCIVIAAALGGVMYGEWEIWILGPKYHHPISGKILNVTESHGKYSSEFLALVEFPEGTQHVNLGHLDQYKVGDTYTNTLEWIPGFGLCGTAYGYDPLHGSVLLIVLQVIAFVVNLFSFVGLAMWGLSGLGGCKRES
jgi:hypothetical protein